MPTLRARGLAFAVDHARVRARDLRLPAQHRLLAVPAVAPAGLRSTARDLLGVIPLGTDTEFYVLTIVVLAARACAAVRGLRASRTGRVLIGVRDNERGDRGVRDPGAQRADARVRDLRLPRGRRRRVVRARSSSCSSSQTFTPDVSLRIFAMVVVGGLGSISGAVLGAVFVYGVQYFLPFEYAFLATGAGLLLVLLLVPGGLGALFGDARDGVLRWYARRKGIRVPSLVADTLVEPTPPSPTPGAIADAAIAASSSGHGDARMSGRAGGPVTVARSRPRVWFTVRGFPIHVPRKPRRFFEEMSGGEALLPLIVLVGLNCVNNLDQTAFGILGPDIRDAFHLSNQGFLTLVALTQLGGLLLAVPLAYYSDRLPRVAIAVVGRRDVGGVRPAHRPRGHGAGARDRAVGRGHRPRGDHAVAQLAALRLLPARGPTRRVRLPRDRASRSAACSGPRSAASSASTSGGASRSSCSSSRRSCSSMLGLAVARAGPRPLGTRGGGRERRGDRHRRDPAFVRGVGAHPLAGRHAAAHLVLAAVPRGVVHRADHAHVALLRARVPSRRLPARASSPRSRSPAQIIAILLGIPLASRLMLRDPGVGLRLLAVARRRDRRSRGPRSRSRPTSASRSR